MKSRLKKLRRNRPTAPCALAQAVEMLEQRMLLSVATITNNPSSAPADGALTVSVDSYGSFGETFPQSGALYTPFTSGNEGNTVAASSLYFEPAGGFLTEGDVIDVNPLPGVGFSQQSTGSVTSEFTVAGFDITLTQTVEPIPSTDSTTDLVQTYTITNVSNATYDNSPFTVVRYLQSDMQYTTANKNYAGLSGDERIAIAFDNTGVDSPFVRIDVSGVDASGDLVADWEDPTNASGASIVPNGADTQDQDNQYYNTIIANQGIPVADQTPDPVQGDTNGDLLDDTTSPYGNVPIYAVMALSDTLTIPMGSSVTYTTTTGWGDTGTETPEVYRKPGTFDISAITTSAPHGTNAVVQVTRTDGSLGHASVYLDNTFPNTAVPGQPGDPNADYQSVTDDDTSVNPITLLDGQTSTGVAGAQDNPSFAVFPSTKIEPAKDITVAINNPTFGALTKNTPPTLTSTNVHIPAANQPSPFHFATTDSTTDQPVTTSWTEGQSATIAVQRDGDDNVAPTNTGPYGNFSVQYTITGSGTNPATPGVDFVDNTPGTTFDPTTDTYTGSLQFTGADDNTDAQLAQIQDIQLQTLTDNLYEGPETFTITLQASDTLLVSTPSTFTGTILDQQSSGPVHMQFASQSVDESSGAQTIGVLRTGSTDGQFTIGYTIAGSGTEPVVIGTEENGVITPSDADVIDETPGAVVTNGTDSGTLTFAVGATSPEQALVLDLVPTNQAAVDKTLTITLTNPDNLPDILGAPSSETLTITNNNKPGEVYFANGPTASIAEGADPTTGTPYKILTLQVTRDPADGDSGAVSVNYSTADGTAVAGTDYQATTGTLTWADGQSGPQDINVEVYNDTTDPYPRSDKTFSVALSDPSGGVALASPSSVVVTITDDQQPGINLSDTTYSVDEKDPSTGQPGVADIVVQRNLAAGQAEAPWSFTYSISPGTALAGVDYGNPSGSTTVNVTDPTQNTYTLQIPILADDNNTNDTSFTVRLTSGSIGTDTAALGANVAATINITNADTDVALGSTTYTATPGSGTVPITINRTGRLDEAINVSYTTADGTATAGTDYTATTGTVEIPAGQSSVTVNVPILTPANSTLPTRAFTFKITSAVLADSSQSNSYTVNYSSTPATIGIAGLVTATGISLQAGKGGKITMVTIDFSDDLSSSGANNTYNYILTTAGKKGAFNSQIALTNATPDASGDSVTLFTKKPLSANKLYQLSIRTDGGLVSMSNEPFITGAPGGLGGTQIATFATGSKIKYTDPDGDIVTLQTKRGGSMQFINGINGGYPSLTVFGTTKTELTGSLKADGDGHTIIASLNNPDGVQDLLADNPRFSIE